MLDTGIWFVFPWSGDFYFGIPEVHCGQLPHLSIYSMSIPVRNSRNNRHDERRMNDQIKQAMSHNDSSRPGFKYAPSKWETVDQSELEAQGTRISSQFLLKTIQNNFFSISINFS